MKPPEPGAVGEVTKPIGTLEEKWKLLPEFLHARGLVRQHIASFNYFVSVEMPAIVSANEEVRSDADPSFFLHYKKIYIGKPQHAEEQMTINDTITPMECRTRGLTYSAPIYVDIKFTQGKRVVEEQGLVIGKLPIMLRSRKCVLAGKAEPELARLKECPYDPGGYFVVRGGEKVILIQEQLSKNRVLIENDEKGQVGASVTSSTHERKSRSNIVQRKGRLYIRHNILAIDLPVVVMLKAMGISSDMEIVSLVGPEVEVRNAMAPSLQECAELEVHSQNQALAYIGRHVRTARNRPYSRRRSPVEEGRGVLSAVLLPHVPVRNYDFREKAVFVAYMVRRVVLATKGLGALSDKDYYGNKRLELAGAQLSLLFEDLFKQFNSRIKMHVDKELAKANRAHDFNVMRHMVQWQDILTGGFVQALATGNWTLKRFRMDKKGVTETVSRLSFIAALGHMTRIRSHVEKTRKISGPRALQPSQWGLVCPSDTPEGEQCGLVKSLALLAHVTSDVDTEPLAALLYDLGVEEIGTMTGDEMYAPPAYLVIMNGIILGVHRQPHRLVSVLRELRRHGRVGEFVSIYTHAQERCVHVASDGGRVCRPLIVCDPATGRPHLRRVHLQELGAGVRDFRSFLHEGLIEYVDANEENVCMVALQEDELQPGVTHMEIDPMTILGVVSGLIPYPHHNQSPRNTYQCAMGKQAIGTIGLNQFERDDVSPLNTMVYPMKPMVHSRVLEMVHFSDLGAGQNAIVAVMSYSGYDIEDAVVLNQASVDRGYGRVVIFRRYKATVRSHPNGTNDAVRAPPLRSDYPDMEESKWRKLYQRFEALGPDGIAEVGARIEPGCFLVNRETPENTTDIPSDPAAVAYRPSRLTFKEPTAGQVHKVLVTSSDTERFVVKTVVRDMRRPELGDKFSSRHGQKGVVGLVVSQQDMPFNDQGICPDMIMNPHGFPSRMTVGKMIELVSGKAGLCDGRFRYGSAFSGDGVAGAADTLIQHGFNYAGKDLLTSGLTGETHLSYVFMGPVYYQRLKHMVKDKMFARSRGPHMVLTRQPTQGRARDGGLRVGEMERDCLVAHGTSLLLVERLLLSSDPFTASVCQTCGMLASPKWCQYCRSGRAVSDVRIPYACKLLFQELQSMNIKPKLSLAAGGYFDRNSVSSLIS